MKRRQARDIFIQGPPPVNHRRHSLPTGDTSAYHAQPHPLSCQHPKPHPDVQRKPHCDSNRRCTLTSQLNLALEDTVGRVFLGWDHPVLPTAAAHLIDHYIEGPVADLRPATIVLPGGRARRRIVELLLDEAEARGARLIPAEATTVGGLPELLYTSPKPFADEATSRRAWSRALRDVDRETVERVFPHLPENDKPTEWNEYAGMLAGLHETLAREGHPFAHVVKICRSGLLFDDGARWEGLAQVQKRYLRLLEESGLADRFETRRLALESEVPPFAGDIWLVSIVELPRVTRRLVEASRATVRALIHSPAELDDGTDATAVFDTFGLPSANYWETATVPLGDQILTVVERPVDQAEAVMDGLGSLGGEYSAEEIVLAVHGESQVVPYLEQRLEARDVRARYAAGTPLFRTGPVRLLQAVADYLNDPTFQALAALIRHPDAGPLAGPTDAAAAGLEAIEVADRYFSDHLPFRVRGGDPPWRTKGSPVSSCGPSHRARGPTPRFRQPKTAVRVDARSDGRPPGGLRRVGPRSEQAGPSAAAGRARPNPGGGSVIHGDTTKARRDLLR